MRGSLFVPVAVGDVTYGNCCPIRRRGGRVRSRQSRARILHRPPAPPRSVDRVKMACYISGLSAYRGLVPFLALFAPICTFVHTHARTRTDTAVDPSHSVPLIRPFAGKGKRGQRDAAGDNNVRKIHETLRPRPPSTSAPSDSLPTCRSGGATSGPSCSQCACPTDA